MLIVRLREMKTLGIILSFFVLAFAQSRADDEKTAIYAALEAVVDATFEYDFEQLASRMHPEILRHFRQVIGVTYDRLVEKRNATEVLEVIGLSDSPARSKMSDKALFVALATRAKELDPDFIGSADILPIDVHGTVFSADGRAFVVYEYTGQYSSKKSSVGFLRPTVICFKKIGDEWLLYSNTFTQSIPRAWVGKLREQKPAPEMGESGP